MLRAGVSEGVPGSGSGQNSPADCYRKVIEFARQHPEQYGREFEKTFQMLVAELDLPATT